MRIATVIALCLVSGTALAQPLTRNPANDPLVGSVGLGYIATDGNTDTTNFNATFRALYDRGGEWTHLWTALAISARTNGFTVAKSEIAGYKAQRDFGKNAYVFGEGDWRQDEFSGYSRQSAEVVGYGRKLIETDRHILFVEGGLGKKQSSLVDGDKLDETIIHGGLDYLLHIGDNALFTQRLLLEVGDDNRYTESMSTLKAKIHANLSLGASYVIRNNSHVPFGIARTDRYTAITLEYGF